MALEVYIGVFKESDFWPDFELCIARVYTVRGRRRDVAREIKSSAEMAERSEALEDVLKQLLAMPMQEMPVLRKTEPKRKYMGVLQSRGYRALKQEEYRHAEVALRFRKKYKRNASIRLV